MQKKELSKLVLTTLLTGSVLWGGDCICCRGEFTGIFLGHHGCYRNQNGNDR